MKDNDYINHIKNKRAVLDEMFKQIQLFGQPLFYTLQKPLWGLRPDFRVKALKGFNKTLG